MQMMVMQIKLTIKRQFQCLISTTCWGIHWLTLLLRGWYYWFNERTELNYMNSIFTFCLMVFLSPVKNDIIIRIFLKVMDLIFKVEFCENVIINILSVVEEPLIGLSLWRVTAELRPFAAILKQVQYQKF